MTEKVTVSQYVLFPQHGIFARVDNVLRALTPEEHVKAQMMTVVCLNSGWTIGEIELLLASNPKPKLS